MTSPLQLLQAWLHRQLPPDAADWLEGQATAVRGAQTDRGLFLAVSLVHRQIGKDDLSLSAADKKAAETARLGWRPAGWSLDQAARIYLLLAAGGEPSTFARRIEQLFSTADVGEFDRVLPRAAALPRTIAIRRACRRGAAHKYEGGLRGRRSQ